jgi:hypothetical protein
VRGSHGAAAARLVACAREMEERALNRRGVSCIGSNAIVKSSAGPRHGKYGKVGAVTCGEAVTNGEWRCGPPMGGSGTRGTSLCLARVTLRYHSAGGAGLGPTVRPEPRRARGPRWCRARRRTRGAASPVATQLSLFDC